MDRSLYLAMSGAKQTMLSKTANANNLANSQTDGFKSDFQRFKSMPVFGPGFPTRVYAMAENPGTDFSPGTLRTTGRELDIAIDGDGWIAVQDAEGNEVYTRTGNLRVTPEGSLQTSKGMPVLGDNGPLLIPEADKLEIGHDGTISLIPLGDDANTLVEIGRIKLVNPSLDSLEKSKNGFFTLKKGVEPVAADANIRLVQGALEGSNVNVIISLAEMIEHERNFELQVKVMQSVDENSEYSARLMQMA